MSYEGFYQILALDVPALLSALFAAVSCALLGNYLVLRRLSLMGDTLSHAVLPGIVVAFLLTGSRASVGIFIGAAGAGILAAVLVEVVRKLGHLESGAAMGVVFSILFAGGVVLMEQAAARNVDLDADCLLHGQLEAIFWSPPNSFSELMQSSTLGLIPGELLSSALVMLGIILFVTVFFKELAITSFDPALATSLGFNATMIHYVLMLIIATAVVASFKIVGSILVIAMLICPAACARMFTDRLRIQLLLSVVFAAVSALGGYLLGAFGPLWLGYDRSVSSSGMIVVLAGVLLGLSAIAAPRYGVISKQLRRFYHTVQTAREDLLGLLYRLEELTAADAAKHLTPAQAVTGIGGGFAARIAFRKATLADEVSFDQGNVRLTPEGRHLGRSLVRTHRLWESYLVNLLGLRPDHVHQTAMELEHYTSAEMAERLAARQEYPAEDPHGKAIPEEDVEK